MRTMLLGVVIVVMSAVAGVAGAVLAQSNSLTIGPMTLNVPNNSPAVTITTPTKSGTLALVGDAAPAQAGDFRGVITLSGGKGLAQFPANISTCIVSDRSGNTTAYQVTTNGLAVQGVGPTVDYSCK